MPPLSCCVTPHRRSTSNTVAPTAWGQGRLRGAEGLTDSAVGGVHLDATDDVVVVFDADHPAVAAGHSVAEVADAVVQHSLPAAKLLPRRGHHAPQTPVASRHRFGSIACSRAVWSISSATTPGWNDTSTPSRHTANRSAIWTRRSLRVNRLADAPPGKTMSSVLWSMGASRSPPEVAFHRHRSYQTHGPCVQQVDNPLSRVIDLADSGQGREAAA